jgi:hypothetical protein
MADDDRLGAEAPVASGGEPARSTEPARSEPRDVVFVHGRDEQGYNVLRRREDRLEVGKLRELDEGRPIHGEVVRLRGRPEHERLFDVDVVLEKDAKPTRAAGPPQVATRAYRERWEAIFGSKRRRSEAN